MAKNSQSLPVVEFVEQRDLSKYSRKINDNPVTGLVEAAQSMDFYRRYERPISETIRNGKPFDDQSELRERVYSNLIGIDTTEGSAARKSLERIYLSGLELGISLVERLGHKVEEVTEMKALNDHAYIIVDVKNVEGLLVYDCRNDRLLQMASGEHRFAEFGEIGKKGSGEYIITPLGSDRAQRFTGKVRNPIQGYWIEGSFYSRRDLETSESSEGHFSFSSPGRRKYAWLNGGTVLSLGGKSFFDRITTFGYDPRNAIPALAILSTEENCQVVALHEGARPFSYEGKDTFSSVKVLKTGGNRSRPNEPIVRVLKGLNVRLPNGKEERIDSHAIGEYLSQFVDMEAAEREWDKIIENMTPGLIASHM